MGSRWRIYSVSTSAALSFTPITPIYFSMEWITHFYFIVLSKLMIFIRYGSLVLEAKSMCWTSVSRIGCQDVRVTTLAGHQTKYVNKPNNNWGKGTYISINYPPSLKSSINDFYHISGSLCQPTGLLMRFQRKTQRHANLNFVSMQLDLAKSEIACQNSCWNLCRSYTCRRFMPAKLCSLGARASIRSK